MNDLKQKLYQLCVSATEQRIHAIKQNIQTLQEAANEETKSSAGDKYETSRAMMQLEIEKLRMQLGEAEKGAGILKRIDPVQSYEKVQQGALVLTDQGNFFLSISAGRMEIDERIVFAISSESPVGSRLIGKQAGDTLLFQNKHYKVVQVQ